MIEDTFQQYIRKIILKRDNVESFDIYPFSLNSVRCLDNIELHPNVTFLIGENGSGKSTLLEAIAVAYGFNPEGGTKNFNFSTVQTHSNLYEYIKLVKGARKPKDGFFLRSESFYNVASNIQELDQSGMGPRIIDSYGGISLHNQSHGESFMAVLLNRLGGNGVYIFDEPEAALSPTRQMALISRIHELVNKDSQFIIATHSPIIMSYPNSKIYSFDDGFKQVEYEDTEHYQVTKRFMNNTSKMLDILLDNE
jgi:predicted ATPase